MVSTEYNTKLLGQLNAISGHCGYAIPYLTTPLPHDYHHQVFNANYGTLGVLDWLHGTTGNFDEWRQKWEAGLKEPEVGDEDAGTFKLKVAKSE